MSELHRTVWPDVGDAPRVLLIPLGSTEQHGPHLPLGTDTIIASSIARSVASVVDVLVAPALAYGSSGEHAGFPGTLSIGQSALEMVVVELVRGLDRWPGPNPRVVLVNGHGGNHQAVIRAVRLLRGESRSVQAWWPTDTDGDAHAGRTETAVLLHVDPSLVRFDRAEPGNSEPIGRLLGSLQTNGVRAVSPNGVLGDPMGASAEEGRRIHQRWVTELVELVRTVAW